MSYRLEKTCKCIEDYTIPRHLNHITEDYDLVFHKGREYQVDVCTLWYQVYQNGGCDDYVFMTEEDFEKYFKLID